MKIEHTITIRKLVELMVRDADLRNVDVDVIQLNINIDPGPIDFEKEIVLHANVTSRKK